MKTGAAFSVYPIETIRDLLFKAVARYGAKPALESKRSGKYVPLSFADLKAAVEALATGFAGLGLRKGDKIGILAENRNGWGVSYLAAVCSGLVVVPLDKELTAQEIRHLIRFAKVKLLIASGSYVRQVSDDRLDLPGLEVLVCMEQEKMGADWTLAELIRVGGHALEDGNRAFFEVSVVPDDLAVIIFTSGTTGLSKGVMLSHGNIVSNVQDTSYHVGIDQNDVLLSVLPLHHTYEATAGFLTALYQGASVCYAESLRRVAENLRETRASVMLAVPALFEAMYRRLESGIRQKGAAKFKLAKGVASVAEAFLKVKIRRSIFRQVHERLGGNLRLLICGGAAMKPEIAEGYRALGIDFVQGYGLTEHSPIVSVNRIDRCNNASVGLPLPRADVKIRDGEITVAGPSVMRGYFMNEAATQEAVIDGRLHTGDLGYFDSSGFLFVTGRKKSVIVTPNGKNVHPEELEEGLGRSKYVLESLVWGGAEEDPSKVEVQAIIVPNLEAFDERFGAANYTEEVINSVISEEIKLINKELAGFKRIRKFVLRETEFEKTTTRKIKRYLYTHQPKSVAKRG